MQTDLSATLYLFTFKDGLFARLAHDLRLVVRDFEITIEQREVSARFRLESLGVDGVVRGERVDASVLSHADTRRIHDTITREILGTHAHPEALFRGRVHGDAGPRYRVDGQLTLRAVTQAVHVEVEPRGESMIATATLVPSRFGIAPYKALGGAIRLQDRVEVRLELPVGPDVARSWLTSPTPLRLHS